MFLGARDPKLPSTHKFPNSIIGMTKDTIDKKLKELMALNHIDSREAEIEFQKSSKLYQDF